jgi:hypothetical protein
MHGMSAMWLFHAVFDHGSCLGCSVDVVDGVAVDLGGLDMWF